MEAALEARMKGVRVYTVGVGTARDPRTVRSGCFGVLDEPTLRAIVGGVALVCLAAAIALRSALAPVADIGGRGL